MSMPTQSAFAPRRRAGTAADIEHARRAARRHGFGQQGFEGAEQAIEQFLLVGPGNARWAVPQPCLVAI
jgi:hypothetical protein